MVDGKKIAACALAYLNTPHVNGAKVKNYGIDCGMLIIAALEDAGEMDKDSLYIKPYSNEWHLHHAEEWFLGYVKKIAYQIPLADIQAGDIILFQFGRCVSHGAIYVGDNTVVHAVVGQGVILTELNDTMFINNVGKSRLRGVYRYKGKGQW